MIKAQDELAVERERVRGTLNRLAEAEAQSAEDVSIPASSRYPSDFLMGREGLYGGQLRVVSLELVAPGPPSVNAGDDLALTWGGMNSCG